MFSEIIVPVDIGQKEQARLAIRAAKLNLAPDGQMMLLHVLEPIPTYVAAQLESSVLDSAADQARLVLDELKASEGLPAETQVVVETGRTYQTIVSHIKDPQAQAIVMSAHSPQFSDIVLGSVAGQVVRHAKCSVFVLRS
ncbi:MAG: universal stress protein [Burkholderiaceae bacterium]